jgi:hypothetical protein
VTGGAIQKRVSTPSRGGTGEQRCGGPYIGRRFPRSDFPSLLFFFRKLSFTAFAALTGETRHAATPAVDDAWRTCETTGREIPAGDNTVHTYKKLHAD